MIPADDETSLLSAVLNGYRDVPALIRIVSGQDFYRPQHEQIWNACTALHADGFQPDPHLVRARLAEQGATLDPGYVLDLLSVPGAMPVNAPHYAAKVHDLAIRRQMKDSGARLIQLADDESAQTTDLVARFRHEIDALEQDRHSERTNTWSAFEQVMQVIDEGEAPSIPTPWPDLNRLLGGGWFPGQMITIGARPGVGKSLMLENAATEAARRTGQHVLFASLEMSAKELMQRTLAWTAKVELSRIRTGKELSDIDLDKIARVSDLITGTRLEIDDRPAQTMDEIRASAWEVRQQARRQGSDLAAVFIDYLQLVTPPAEFRGPNHSRQQKLGAISRAVKNLAKEMQIPVAVGAQVNRSSANRAGGDGEPAMSDMRESGDIEQDSDVVILLHPETVDDGGHRRILTGDIRTIVAKQRQGPVGVVTLREYGHLARLHSAAS